MIATPDVRHITRPPFAGQVYEPAEDTFALLDALEQDAEALRHLSPRLVVEVGVGSGCVTTFLAGILGANTAAYLATDINPLALQAAQATAQLNTDKKQQIDIVQTSVLQAIHARCLNNIDVLLFNPPYVPTTEEEERLAQDAASIAGSWAGGALGTNLVDALLPQIPGRFYFVAIRQNDPNALVARLSALGLQTDICLSRRAGREHLFIVRATRIR